VKLFVFFYPHFTRANVGKYRRSIADGTVRHAWSIYKIISVSSQVYTHRQYRATTVCRVQLKILRFSRNYHRRQS
jgi:hypothetical protein